MSDCGGALAKLVLRKMHTKTNLIKLKFSARKAVHDSYQCWKFELKISSDSGDMHFSAIKPRRGGCPREGRDGKCEGRNKKCEFLARESVNSSPFVRIFGKGKCKLIANFSAAVVTSLPSFSVSLSLSLSLTESTSRTKRFRASYNKSTGRAVFDPAPGVNVSLLYSAFSY